MDEMEVVAEARKQEKAKNLRREGLVPAVLYGREHETELLQIEAQPLEKVLAVAGTHQLISLKIDNQPPIVTMAREIQRDVIKRDCLHVDFLRIRMDEKVTAEVPLYMEGEAPAVLNEGGVLTQGLDQIEIECLPADLISSLTINVEGLTEINDTLVVADLTIPDNITVLSDPESMIVKIEAPRKEEELEALLEEEEVVVSAEPEVITEAREEEEEAPVETEEE